MKKVLFVGLLLTLFCLSANAKIDLVLPFEESNITDSSLDLGLIAPGESFSFTISSDSGFEQINRWTNAVVVKEDLPDNWNAEQAISYGPTLTLKVNSSPKTLPGNYFFKVKAYNESKRLEPEYFTVNISIKSDLQKASVPLTIIKTVVGSSASFDLVLINDSLADHSFELASDLPAGWLESQSYFVPAGKQKTVFFSVKPLVYGARDFKLTVKSKLNGSSIAVIPLRVEAKPTLKGKYLVGLQGYSFFTPTLAPFYAINSLIAEFLFG